MRQNRVEKSVCAVILCLLWCSQLTYGWHALIDLDEYLNMTGQGSPAPANASNASSTSANPSNSTTPSSPPTAGFPSVINPSKDTLELPGTRFSILRKRISWPEAVTQCQLRNLRLVSLPLLSDAKSLIEAIKNISTPYFEGYDDARKQYEFGMDRRYWIGLTDMVVEGDWEWIAEGYSLRYHDVWYPGQPDHNKQTPPTSEHCASLWNPGYGYGDTHLFNDEDCNKKNYAICGTQPPFLMALLRDRVINKAIPASKLAEIIKEIEEIQGSGKTRTRATQTQFDPLPDSDTRDVDDMDREEERGRRAKQG